MTSLPYIDRAPAGVPDHASLRVSNPFESNTDISFKQTLVKSTNTQMRKKEPNPLTDTEKMLFTAMSDLPPLPRSLGAIDIADRKIEPFAGAIAAWLASCDVEAALIRPDRYIFGTGSPTDLVAAWDRSLHGNAGICSESVGNQATWDAALPDRPISMAG